MLQIYKITNLENGMSYIGKDQTDNPRYMGSGMLLWNSYRKRFGRDDLDFNKRTHHKWVYDRNAELQIYDKTVLAECDDKHELCELEKYYIEKYNTIRPSGYNIAEGGEGGCLISGYTQEERAEWKRKISEATKIAMARPDVREKIMETIEHRDEEWRKRISESLTGRKGTPMSEETKAILRNKNLGNKYGLGNKSRTGYRNSEEMNKHISEGAKKVVHTKEWNEKVSASLKGKQKSEEHKATLRKPKPKFRWLLPDGSIRIMDASNGGRHTGWVKLEKVE